MATKPRVEQTKISELTPDAQNANLGTERGLRALDDSLASVGLGRSVVTDKHGRIIAGNKTVERATDRGFEDAIVVHTDGKQLVVVQRDDLDLADGDPNNDARKLAFFDNRVAELDLNWSPEQLQADKEAGVEIVDKLWHPVELDKLGVGNGESPEDPGAQVGRAAELQEKWQVVRGDVWQIGKHRILCGDSTCADDVELLMGGVKADLCFTSPPYNMADNAKTDGYLGSGNKSKYTSVDDDNMDHDEYVNMLYSATWGAMRCSEYVFINIQMLANNKVSIIEYLSKLKAQFVDVAIWNKVQAQPALAENIFTSAFEFIFIFTDDEYPKRTIRTAQFARGMMRNVYQSGNASRNEYSDIHAATYPLEFVKWGIMNFTNIGRGVYDPFLGSGTTLVACEQTGRVGYGMEIAPEYVAVCLERLAGMELTPERK